MTLVVADDYFLLKFREVSVGDIIQVSTLGGAYNLKVLVSTAATVTTEMANGIQAISGAGAVDTISFLTELTTTGANAYTLIDELEGFAFKKVDEMAMRSGFVKPESKFRIIACIKHVINSVVPSRGHTYLPKDKFVPFAAKELGLTAPNVEACLEDAVKHKFIIMEDECIFNIRLYGFEDAIAKTVNTILESVDSFDDKNIPDYILEPCIGFQKDAVSNSLKHKISVITGGPGTGKTWTLKQILQCVKEWGMTVALAAPTGKAANKMQEAIDDKNYECKTIHRLLEYNPFRGFTKNKDDPLTENIIIIDEFSMVDTELAFALFNACKNVKRILIMGDIDQLPSVGPGKVMDAFISSPKIHTTKFRQVHRQAEGSSIIENASRINRGDEIIYDTPVGGDFFFLHRETKEEIVETIPEIIKHAKEEYGFDPIKEVQILCPQKTGDIGTYNLNKVMKSILNPGEGNRRLDKGDRVIQMRNNYKVQEGVSVFNGDTGIIERVDIDQSLFHINFGYGNVVQYPFKFQDDLQLSYAITIHKSQGSEFPLVVIPIHTTNYIMLQRNLIYTAITRGKSKVIVIGTRKACKRAVKNADPVERYNRLVKLLQ